MGSICHFSRALPASIWDAALKSEFLLAFRAHKEGCDNDTFHAIFPSIWVSWNPQTVQNKGKRKMTNRPFFTLPPPPPWENRNAASPPASKPLPHPQLGWGGGGAGGVIPVALGNICPWEYHDPGPTGLAGLLRLGSGCGTVGKCAGPNWSKRNDLISENSRRLWLFPGSVRGFSNLQENSGKVPGKLLENFSRIAKCYKFWDLGHRERPTCREPWVHTARTSSPPSVRDVFKNRQFQPSRVFLIILNWISAFARPKWSILV